MVCMSSVEGSKMRKKKILPFAPTCNKGCSKKVQDEMELTFQRQSCDRDLCELLRIQKALPFVHEIKETEIRKDKEMTNDQAI